MKSRTELVMSALAEAVPYARTCCSGQIENDELTSICYETMQKCAKRYDPKKGKFFAFCKPRIRGALLRYWNTTGAVVRNADCVSLDAPVERESTDLGTGDPRSFEGQYAAGMAEPDFERIDFHEKWAEVSRFMAEHCTDRERALVQLVFSMNFTFEQAGARFDISRAAAQAIVSKVIERIKKALVK